MNGEPPDSPSTRPVSGASGSDDLGWPLRGVTPDWADEAEWARMCAGLGEEPEPPDLEEEFYADPDHGAPGQWEELPPEVLAARAGGGGSAAGAADRGGAGGGCAPPRRAAPAGDPGGPGRRVRAGPAAGCAGPQHHRVRAGR